MHYETEPKAAVDKTDEARAWLGRRVVRLQNRCGPESEDYLKKLKRSEHEITASYHAYFWLHNTCHILLLHMR